MTHRIENYHYKRGQELICSIYLSGIMGYSADLPVTMHFKIDICLHCHKSVPILILMLLRLKAQANKASKIHARLFAKQIHAVFGAIKILCSSSVGCWQFLSWPYLRSYLDGYRLVTMRTHGDFIVLSQWQTRLPAPWSHYMITHSSRYPDSGPISPCPILIIPNAWLGRDKYKLFSH